MAGRLPLSSRLDATSAPPSNGGFVVDFGANLGSFSAFLGRRLTQIRVLASRVI
jgi:hypothetical protein